MTDEKKKDFTRRLTSCNRGEMIVIIYDMFFAYLEDADAALSAGDGEGCKYAVRHADAVLVELQETLNFDYPLARTLFAVYQYARDQLALALAARDSARLKEAKHHIDKLYQAFVKVAEADTSEPMMQHTESVTVGMTYGRGTLNEAANVEANRGFWV